MTMIDITTGTLEEKIIKVIQEEYPLTIADLSDRIHVSRRKLRFELLKLHSKGIIELEPLPDKTYIRLLRSDIRFVGRQHQETFIKRRQSKYKSTDDSPDDTMYR
jgi:predicted ArsR family transcriptional regulator